MQVPSELKGLFNNWDYPLYAIDKVDYTLFDQEYLRLLVEGIQRLNRWDKDFETIKDWEVPKEVALGIVDATGKKALLPYIMDIEGDVICMCQPLEEFERESRQQGIELGVEQSRQNGCVVILTNQLNQILGQLSLNLTKELNNSSEEQLIQLSLSITHVHSEEDVLDILRKQ